LYDQETYTQTKKACARYQRKADVVGDAHGQYNALPFCAGNGGQLYVGAMG
jgi:hypothetical protein